MIGRCPMPGPADAAMRALLDGVDCNARSVAEAGYVALGGPHALLPSVMTALLTIYIALLGWRLMFGLGGTRLSDMPLIGVKIGTILALVTGWASFQTLVFDTANAMPIRVAQVIAGPARIGDPVEGVQAAHDAIIAAATLPADAIAGTPAMPPKPADQAADNALFSAATLLFLSTIGVLAMAKVATAMLTAIGPILIALFLLDATRGLFVGWVRALVAVAIVPLLSWSTTVVALLTLRPALDALAADGASPAAASRVVAIVQVFAGAQALLLIGAVLLAAGFRLPGIRRERRETSAPRPALPAPAIMVQPSRAARLAEQVVQPRAGRIETMALSSHSSDIRISRSSSEATPRPLRLGEATRRPTFRERRVPA